MSRIALPVVAAAALVAGCSDDGGDGGSSTTSGAGPAAPGVDCPVQPADVGAALGFRVDVDGEEGANDCTYVAVNQELHPGSQVTVVVRRVTRGAFALTMAGVQERLGPTEPFRLDRVDGADAGYVLRLGVAVQVAVVVDNTLVTVGVADAGLGAEALVDAAAEIIEAAVPQ